MHHPTKRNMGRRKGSRESIRPSDSASQRMKNTREQEHRSEKRAGNNKAGRTTNIASISRRPNKSKPTLEGSSSSLDPPPYMIRRSIRLVEAWIRDCEKAMAEISENNATESMVSLLGGGITERPSFNDFIYINRPIAKLSRNSNSDNTSIAKPVSSPSGIGSSFQPSKVRDCVYEKPNQPWKHALQGERHNKKTTILSKLWKFRKCKNRDNGGRVRKNDARILDLGYDQRAYNESELLMTGGRSSGLGFSLNALVSQGEKRMYDRCVVHWQSRNKSQDSSMFESNSVQSPSKDTISHQSFQPFQFLKTKHTTFHCTNQPRRMSSGSSWSRPSSLNLGSIIEHSMSPTALVQREAREQERRLAAENNRPRTPSPFRPSTPRPIQPWKSKAPRKQPSSEEIKIATQELAGTKSAEFTSPIFGVQPKSSYPVREKPASLLEPGGDQMNIPGGAKQGLQALATNGERRRANEVPVHTRGFGGAADQWTKVNHGTVTYTKNRERRRAERRAAGRVMDTRDEEIMITSGDKKVAKGAGVGNDMRSEGQERTAWNADNEPVASGYELEKETKRKEVSRSKSHSDNYRREERQKYWARK